jgi:hypothetical protein
MIPIFQRFMNARRGIAVLVIGLLGITAICAAAQSKEPGKNVPALDLPDAEIVEAYEQAAVKNVLAAVNPKVFFGYFSVCADGQGFGYGCSYPSLDGHQMCDALLFLGQLDVVKANWDYVRKFQRPNGQLPLAIFPQGGGTIGPAGSAPPYAQARIAANGGLYDHWVPGDPLRALAGPTYIQNADAIYRYTQDREWLKRELPSVNRAAEYLAWLTKDDGAVRGAGYYVERPTRIEFDGVAQCHAADAFRRVAALNDAAGGHEAAKRYRELADRVIGYFRHWFWVKDRFAEYLNPEHGFIVNHGLSDTDWSAIALGIATPEQTAVLWPQLKDEKRFYYGGMPSGPVTHPEKYEDWEFTTRDRHDLAAMGRVWHLEAGARARMGDGQGLVDSIRRVCKAGRENGYYWRERYNEKGGYGPNTYCEYPANLIRIVQRFLLGVEFGLDGTLQLSPTAPEEFWKSGFGQTLKWRGRILVYRMRRGRIAGEYSGDGPQRLSVRLEKPTQSSAVQFTLNDVPAKATVEDGKILVPLPAAPAEKPCRFEIRTASPE